MCGKPLKGGVVLLWFPFKTKLGYQLKQVPKGTLSQMPFSPWPWLNHGFKGLRPKHQLLRQEQPMANFLEAGHCSKSRKVGKGRVPAKAIKLAPILFKAPRSPPKSERWPLLVVGGRLGRHHQVGPHADRGRAPVSSWPKVVDPCGQ